MHQQLLVLLACLVAVDGDGVSVDLREVGSLIAGMDSTGRSRTSRSEMTIPLELTYGGKRRSGVYSPYCSCGSAGCPVTIDGATRSEPCPSNCIADFRGGSTVCGETIADVYRGAAHYHSLGEAYSIEISDAGTTVGAVASPPLGLGDDVWEPSTGEMHTGSTHAGPNGRRLGLNVAGRRLSNVTRWTDCFESDTVDHDLEIGIFVDSMAIAKLGLTGDAQLSSKVTAWVNSILANAAMIYYIQIGITLVVKEIYLDPITGLPGDACPEGEIKEYAIPFTLWRRQYRSAGSSNGLAHWHALTDCYPSGSKGVATLGTLCTDRATAVTSIHQYFPELGQDSTWQIFAHELGHNFGGNHSFEEGQGQTGGIMDYGDGKFEGSYQFNSQYRKDAICEVLTDVKEVCQWFKPSGPTQSPTPVPPTPPTPPTKSPTPMPTPPPTRRYIMSRAAWRPQSGVVMAVVAAIAAAGVYI